MIVRFRAHSTDFFYNYNNGNVYTLDNPECIGQSYAHFPNKRFEELVDEGKWIIIESVDDYEFLKKRG